MEKQQLLFEQSRLADRGAAEMVLLYISACRGCIIISEQCQKFFHIFNMVNVLK